LLLAGRHTIIQSRRALQSLEGDCMTTSQRALEIAIRIEEFVRSCIVPYEKDPRRDHHGAPTDELVMEMREHARQAGVLTPHILDGGEHLNQQETAAVLIKTGLSPLGPLACNTMAPDEGNMYLLGKVGSPQLKGRFLAPLVEGRVRSAFFMTEPADEAAQAPTRR
jgi:acyl-CoA dehydrogenase